MPDLRKSRFGATRIPLFRFDYQGTVWRFAQAERDITAGGYTWTAAPISRDPVRQTSESAQDKVKCRMAYLRDPAAPLADLPATQPIGELWHPYLPSGRVQVAFLEAVEDGDAAPAMVWSGEVSQPAFTDVELELICTPGNNYARAANQGPRLQRACWKVPYSTGIRGCNLLPADFEVAASLTAVDGLTLTAAEFVGTAFPLLQGKLSWVRSNGWVETKTIVVHDAVAGTVRVLDGGAELAAGLAVVALPTCPGTWDACAARRADPQLHFGGAQYLRVKNPYDGESMSWEA